MLFAVLGILSSIIFILGDIPYVRDTLTSKTKPHRVTWGIAALMNTVGFANQWASGARNSLWLFAAGALMTAFIFGLSFRHGVGGYAKLDIFCLVVCALGIALWIVFDSPLMSIFATIIVDIASIVPSYAKAKRAPETETRISWLVGSFSVLLATISVGKLDWQLLILPGASCLLQCYMVYILYFETKRPRPAQV